MKKESMFLWFIAGSVAIGSAIVSTGLRLKTQDMMLLSSVPFAELNCG